MSGRSSLGAVLLRRLAQALGAMAAASVLIWALIPLAPGDPAHRYLEVRNIRAATPAQVAAARHDLGLDRPLLVQYGNWLSRAVRGDLSLSYSSGRPVALELARRFPATARLAAASIGLILLLSVPAGLAGAVFSRRWPDAATRGAASLAAAVPSFVVGLFLLEVVVVRWGHGSVVADGTWRTVWLPAVAGSLFSAARLSRLPRSTLLPAMAADSILVASARGASRLRTLVVHAVPNAAVPCLHQLGLVLGYLVAGEVVIERLFSWPGLGQYAAQAVADRDLPVIQGFAVVGTLSWAVISLWWTSGRA